MTTDIHQHRILILDFGSQYTQLIARRVRELRVYCEILPYDVDSQLISDFKPNGVILSGGPETVSAEHTPRIPESIFQLGVPLLGICYGMQALAHQLGGEVVSADKKEFGYAKLTVLHDSPLLHGIEDDLDPQGRPLLDVWMSHGDHVNRLPAGFVNLATSDNTDCVAMADIDRQFYGLQFHPEVTHTAQGLRMLANFVHTLCGCAESWTAENIIDDAIAHVRAQVGDDKVLLGLSGGVDSAVVAALLHRAIGQQLVCVFVDTGLLRAGESDDVMRIFAEHLGVNVVRADAKKRFYSALKGVSDPEAKRKIAGEQFIRVFEEEANKLEGVSWLAQGTIYPDVIESAGAKSGKAHVIKSHHNVGGLPEDMSFKLIEPLNELFKDEVRELGLLLGLPRHMVFRHPFPGPGLGIRVLGEVKPEFVEILQQADVIFLHELREAGWYDQVSQAFAVFLPVKSVGVQGDARSYEYVIALRAVQTIDFMTARWAELPYDLIARVSERILNEVRGVSRVVYDVSNKPSATIEWE